MNQGSATGVFGKLPAHGDFVQRNLPASFVNSWDDWLQHYISVPGESLQDKWLEVYLTSPIWRFVLSEGAVDNSCWAGVMMPSVDRVGRYFPFTILKQLEANTSPSAYMRKQEQWYLAMEKIALEALQEEASVDFVVQQADNVGIDELVDKLVYKMAGSSPLYYMGIENEQDSFAMNEGLPFILDEVLKNSLSSFSLWATAGSNLVEPCFFTTQGLPSTSYMTSMQNGSWHGSSGIADRLETEILQV